MKKIAFFDEMCYSKKVKMRAYFKFIITCTLSVFFAAAFVVGTTVAVVSHNNSSGMGGMDRASPLAPDLEILQVALPQVDSQALFAGMPSDFIEEGVPEPLLEDKEDRELSYISYRIKKGDMISRIAEQYGVTTDTIVSVNNIKQSRTIQPGNYLMIPSMAGILYTAKKDGERIEDLAKKYNIDAEQCAFVNNLDLGEDLLGGQTLFLPGAAMDRDTLAEINGDAFKLPLKAKYYISSRYGWRVNPFDASKRTYHGGADMACARGTSIYAAREGTVTTAGWSDIYGNYVIITHGNSGYKTLYGHMMSAPLVRKGQYVTTDTIIGKVGSTGQSTGPHLHFTVYKNGRSIDPNSVVSVYK